MYSTQCVVINGLSSSPKSLLYGVPQGSVLGPQLFSIYLSDLGKIIRNKGIQCQFYADDTLLYVTTTISQISFQMSVLELCIQ